MTKDKQLESLFQDLSCNDSGADQPQQPFQVVFIDIKRAAQGDIHCVMKSLDTEDLHYVAISYRWGECQETTIDTGVGYLASITSFDIQDFYQLCATILEEPTMQTSRIDYVWVDAICINQADHSQRKATMRYMTSIYEHAQYILAIPDLHAAYLRTTMASNKHVMQLIQQHRDYIYHLLHGNTKQLYSYDKAFLDLVGVCNTSSLRSLLTKYTDCFADGFMALQQHDRHFDPMSILDHLYDFYHVKDSSSNTSVDSIKQDMDTEFQVQDELYARTVLRLTSDNEISAVKNELGLLHHDRCHDNLLHCPLSAIPMLADGCDRHLPQKRLPQHRTSWPHQIYQRSLEIRQAMHFLMDLVKDWSSRVWVISECHISKRKNNLKFWFTQLLPSPPPQNSKTTSFTFFEFDIHGPKLKTIQYTSIKRKNQYIVASDPVYLTFYQLLIRQLNNQVFLEMMLHSKATKNEDRFYAVFPQFPEYKQIIDNDDVVKNWHITSILSVKLKLYQVMTNEHKRRLLYLSGKGKATLTLPTFATSTIDWQDVTYQRTDMYLKDNPITLPIAITLHYTKTPPTDDDDDHQQPSPPPQVSYYLHLKPKEILIASKKDKKADGMTWNEVFPGVGKRETLLKRLAQRIDPSAPVDVVKIPETSDYFNMDFDLVGLIGSFRKNTWILANNSTINMKDYDWKRHYCSFDEYANGFNVY